MNKKRPGGQTAELPSRPCLLSWASVVGKKESEGPLADTFDVVSQDDTFGEKSWEKAVVQQTAFDIQYVVCCIHKEDFPPLF